MPRKKGSANADFDASRRALLDRLRESLLGDEPPSSFRTLAAAAGVTMPTLRHYFGDREGVIAAVFAECHEGGERELEVAARPTGPFRRSVHDLLRHVADGFRYGRLDRLHAVGLVEGLANERVAGAYLADVLEPTLRAAQRRLEAHIDGGEMRPADPRHAALALLGPVVLLYLHQHGLCGEAAYPIDIDAFLSGHADAFVRAYATDVGE
jgi:AcrR family transcriptional regulator